MKCYVMRGVQDVNGIKPTSIMHSVASTVVNHIWQASTDFSHSTIANEDSLVDKDVIKQLSYKYKELILQPSYKFSTMRSRQFHHGSLKCLISYTLCHYTMVPLYTIVLSV